MSVPPEPAAFAAGIQELVLEFADKADVATMAGALIGSGLEIGLRNGITEEMLQTHFEISVQKIQKLIAQSAQHGAG